MMSSKHYEAIAAVIVDVRRSADEVAPNDDYFRGSDDALAAVAKEMARVFKADNTTFSADKFLDACGVLKAARNG